MAFMRLSLNIPSNFDILFSRSLIEFRAPMISGWENGYAFPSVEYLKKISTYYGVSIDYLVFGDKKQNEGTEWITAKVIVNAILNLYEKCGFTWHIENKDRSYFKIGSNDEPYKMRLSTKDRDIINFFVKYIRLEENKDILTNNAYGDCLVALKNELPDGNYIKPSNTR